MKCASEKNLRSLNDWLQAKSFPVLCLLLYTVAHWLFICYFHWNSCLVLMPLFALTCVRMSLFWVSVLTILASVSLCVHSYLFFHFFVLPFLLSFRHCLFYIDAVSFPVASSENIVDIPTPWVFLLPIWLQLGQSAPSASLSLLFRVTFESQSSYNTLTSLVSRLLC